MVIQDFAGKAIVRISCAVSEKGDRHLEAEKKNRKNEPQAAFDSLYELMEEKAIPECGGLSRIYRHRKSGAQVFTIKNEDKNKVFYIGFRTVPKDDTGVAHILEHSVLCGSQKFPLKDPFVELAKGSLNTFLNAMTYPDKTVYPVASCNDRDFMNLMDVYMDAVLHPNIYRERKIFEQEGWHYEVSPEDGSLSYNGVVYNEMKGAFSNPEQVLERYTMHALFPDTTYGAESGGDPECIPKLSYEAFLDFHRTYYHPSNAYLYLYGDMDMEEKLCWLDREYLSGYDQKDVHSEIAVQKAFSEPKRERIFYSIGENEAAAQRCYLSENYVIADDLDPKMYLAWQILEFVLLEAPGAPLKEALIKAGIGEDVFGGYTSGIQQPYFSVIVKNAEEADEARFHEIIKSCLRELLEKGISRELLSAALNYLEFKYREADYGRMPTGLMLGLTALDSWLYGGKPYTHLCYTETFAFLRDMLREEEALPNEALPDGTLTNEALPEEALSDGRAAGRNGRNGNARQQGYFETLIERFLLDNPFCASVTVVPKPGLTKERDEALAKRLSELRCGLSETELSAIKEEEAALRRYQEEPSSPEAMKSLPVLAVSDIDKTAEKTNAKLCGRGQILWSDFRTNGISYIRVLFDTKELSEEELQLLAFLCFLYSELDTKRHSYRELTNEILRDTGGISFDLSAYPMLQEGSASGAYCGYFWAELRVLSENTEKGLSLVSEILNETLLTDEERIGEKLLEAKSRMQMKLDGSAHAAAVTRAGSYFRADQRYIDLTDGIAFYDFLSAASKFYQIPGKRKHFLKSLAAVAEKLFVKKRMLIAVSGGRAEKEQLSRALPEFRRTFSAAKPEQKKSEAEESAAKRRAVKVQGRLNEGFRTPSQVNYVARSGAVDAKKHPYCGELLVLKGLLNYEYLWQNLRVKGGAYGCMSGFVKSGRGYLVSYRDPQLRKTNEVYQALPAWLDALSLPEADMTKYIIGAVADLDQPLSASIRAARYLSMYLSGVTDEDLQKERSEVLSCTEEKLRRLSGYVREMLENGILCAIGNAEEINQNRDMFASVRDLY